MLQTFSNTLVELYESSENMDLNAFPAEVIRLLKGLVEFDCALLGIAEPSAPNSNHLEIRNALVHGRDPAILLDHVKGSAVDSITRQFMAGLSEPQTSSVSCAEAGQCVDELRAFHGSHEMEHLLVIGEAGIDANPSYLLVLCRRAGNAFNSLDRQHIEAIWPHLLRSLSINRSCFLKLHSHTRGASVALISSNGYIETAEPQFRELYALQWPLGLGRKIPNDVWDKCRRGLDFIGTRVKLKMKLQYDDFTVMQAVAISSVDRLTPAERIVASNFAAGRSAKVIANNLGRSVHTVRSQLIKVYDKLNIHDKGELASYLGASSAYCEIDDAQSYALCGLAAPSENTTSEQFRARC